MPQATRLLKTRSLKFYVIILISLVILCAIWWAVRANINQAHLKVTPVMQKHIQNVRILRDDYGIPHIYGKTDAAAAFGFAYAHAEDDFQEIHTIVAATRGKLSLFRISGEALGNDYYVGLIRAWIVNTNLCFQNAHVQCCGVMQKG